MSSDSFRRHFRATHTRPDLGKSRVAIPIACAYAAAPNCGVSPADLRRMLSALVPSYMLPSRWMALPTLPKNATGKIDRRAIRELFDAHEAVVA